MNFWVDELLDICILIPAIIAGIRFSKINKSYYPFVYCIWLGTFVELFSIFIILKGYSNAVISNIYVLIESILITWQFKCWKLFSPKKYLFHFIVAIFSIFWILENLFISKVTNFCTYFRITYSFFIVIMSILFLNYLILTERRNLMKNSIFIITVSFIFYYTLQILVEAFWVYNVNDSYRISVYDISVITNFIANLLFALAIIWIPIKQRFTLPSS